MPDISVNESSSPKPRAATRTLTVTIRTRTPLWTGGVDGTMDRIHETGILGSLRWWYEAIVRGLGGRACDPTGDYRCPDREGNYCDVCTVFGATGLKRAFRLEGPVWWNEHRDRRLTVKVNNNRGWYLGRGFVGQGELHLRTLRLPEGWTEIDLLQAIMLTSRLIDCWGGLGPKTQQGYGVVEVSSDLELDINRAIGAIQRLQQRAKRRTHNRPVDWPSLDGFFFTKVRFRLDNPKDWLKEQTSHLEPNKEVDWYLKQQNGEDKLPVVPLAPIVRYYLRQLIHDHIQYKKLPNAPVRWRLMGVVNGLWHITDLGKIEESNRWYCAKCKQEWDYLPSKKEHGNCNGKPRKKARCVNCHQEWLSIYHARRDSSTEQVERQRSLLHVSHAYPVGDKQWEFRIWGWIPETLPGRVSRTTVLQHLRLWLGVTQERRWHTVQTNNDTLWSRRRLALRDVQVCWFSKANDEGAEAYLQALLQGWGCENFS